MLAYYLKFVLKIFLYMCTRFACMHVCTPCVSLVRVLSELLDLELQAVVSCHVVLGIEPG